LESNALMILKKWHPDRLNNLIHILNTHRIASDEGRAGLSPGMIECWSEECDQFLRECGYSGGKLSPCGIFSHCAGAIYAIYDESSITYQEAYEYLSCLASFD